MYVTSVVSKYLDSDTIKEDSNFHKIVITHNMIFTEEYASISDEHVEVLSIYYKIC